MPVGLETVNDGNATWFTGAEGVRCLPVAAVPSLECDLKDGP